MNINEINEKIKLALENIKGVLSYKLISQEERDKILELEQEAEKKILYGLGKGLNTGIREILKRDYIVVIANNDDFEWPPEPAIQLVSDGEIIGEEIKSSKKAEEYKKQGHIVVSNLVIFRGKSKAVMSSKNFRIEFPSMSFSAFDNIKEFSDVISASPCPPSHLFICSQMGNKDAPGTILVGFNIVKND